LPLSLVTGLWGMNVTVPGMCCGFMFARSCRSGWGGTFLLHGHAPLPSSPSHLPHV
jgi:hypothetical protein